VSGDRVPWATVGAAVVLGGGALYLLIMSAAIPAQARLYPQIFLVAILGGSIGLATQALLRGRRPLPDGGDAPAPDVASDPDRQGWPLYLALVLYLLVLNRLGFVVATTLFLAAVLLWLRVPAIRGVPLAVAGTLVIFVVFRTAMYVSLPAGPVDIYLLELLYSS
jgi:Tripartite tricarboxylate transporter TctB family